MIPTRKEWQSWGTLEKISYGAQFGAALALLPTVVFSYLGWREARLARNDQAELFMAEKAPHIEIKNIHIVGGLLTVDLHNSGESLAREIRLSNFAQKLGGSRERIEFDQIVKIFSEKGEPSGFSLGKNQTAAVPLASNLDVKNQLGYEPVDLKLAPNVDGEVAVDGTAVLFVSVSYRDVRNGEYSTFASTIMKPPNYRALLDKLWHEQQIQTKDGKELDPKGIQLPVK